MRKTNVVTISAEGRDKGKSFLLTEMSAAQAEDWAIRALLALAHAGVEIENPEGGMAGLVKAGGLAVLTKLRYEDVKPLLDEMWTCVQFQRDPSHPAMALIQDGPNAHVEEVRTRLELRRAVFQLHVDF